MARRRVNAHFAVSPDDENVLRAFRSQLRASDAQPETTADACIPTPISATEDSSKALSDTSGATLVEGHISGKPKKATPRKDFIKSTEPRKPPPPPPNRLLSAMATQFIPNVRDYATALRNDRQRENTYSPTQPSNRSYPKYVPEQPAPDSIYADVTPAQLAQERAETLARRIRINEQARAVEEHARQLELAEASAANPTSSAGRVKPANSPQQLSSTHSPERGSTAESATLRQPTSSTTPVPSPTPLTTEAIAQARKLDNMPGTLQLDHHMEELLSTNSPYKDPATLSPDLQRRVRDVVGSNEEEVVSALLERLTLASKGKSRSISPPGFAPVDPRLVSALVQGTRPAKPSEEERATLEQWTDFAHAEQEKTYDTAEAQLFFKSYPKPEKRQDGKHLPRCVIIQDLPPTATRKLVASIVFGGSIEELRYEPGSPNAYVTFMVPAGATKFYDETDNGIALPGTPPIIVSVELDREPVPMTGLLKQLMGIGVTRCVKVVGVTVSNMNQLIALARGTTPQREIESVQAKKLESGAFAAIINFCSMKEGYSFHNALRYNEDWEHCNVQYVDDPCSLRERPCPSA